MFDSDIGQHCQVCNIRDYLPLKCTDGCNKFFCNKCFHNHKCTEQIINNKTNEIKNNKTNEIKINYKKEVCCYNKCKTSVTSSMGIKCTKCNKKVCIPHRHKHYEICNKDKLQNNPIKKTEPNKPNIFKWLKWFKS